MCHSEVPIEFAFNIEWQHFHGIHKWNLLYYQKTKCFGSFYWRNFLRKKNKLNYTYDTIFRLGDSLSIGSSFNHGHLSFFTVVVSIEIWPGKQTHLYSVVHGYVPDLMVLSSLTKQFFMSNFSNIAFSFDSHSRFMSAIVLILFRVTEHFLFNGINWF